MIFFLIKNNNFFIIIIYLHQHFLQDTKTLFSFVSLPNKQNKNITHLNFMFTINLFTSKIVSKIKKK